MQNANRQSRVHSATMIRKLFLLLLIGAAVWFGARALVHRGAVKATVVFHDARDLSKGDPVVADGAQIGRGAQRVPPPGRAAGANPVKHDRTAHRSDDSLA